MAASSRLQSGPGQAIAADMARIRNIILMLCYVRVNVYVCIRSYLPFPIAAAL